MVAINICNVIILPLAIIQCYRASRKELPDAYMMLRRTSQVLLSWCVVYCTDGLIYHLPAEYWATAFEQLRTAEPALKTAMSALSDALLIVNVSHHYQDWGFGFVFWHSACFSVCVCGYQFF